MNMKSIAILGAGTAGMELVKQLRRQDPQIKITLVDKHQYYFNRRNFIDSLSFTDSWHLERWAKEQGVEFICDCVERVNPKRRKVFFKQRDSLEFDAVVIALGAASKKLEIKGENREGFAYLADIDPFLIKNLLKISSDATVFASTILGIQLALALKNSGKDTRLVAKDLSFFGQEQQSIIDFLKTKSIILYLSADIEEAIGEGIVKAVKINPLKVFGSQLLFVDSGFYVDRGIFEEPIEIINTCLTQYPGIYCLGAFARNNIENEVFFMYNYAQAVSHAQGLAGVITGNKQFEYVEQQTSEEDKQKAIIAMINGAEINKNDKHPQTQDYKLSAIN